MIYTIIAGLILAANGAIAATPASNSTPATYTEAQIEAVADCRSVVSSVVMSGDYSGTIEEAQYLGWEDDVRVDRVFDGIESGENPLVTVTAICGRGW